MTLPYVLVLTLTICLLIIQRYLFNEKPKIKIRILKPSIAKIINVLFN